MNEEYLNKEAIIYSANIKASYPEDVDDNTLEYECHKAFLKGARWHESLPLSGKLSESEKSQIAEWVNDISVFMPDKRSVTMLKIGAESLFGKNLFTPTKQ